MKNIYEIIRQFYNTCSKKGVLREKGFIYRYFYVFEIIAMSILLIFLFLIISIVSYDTIDILKVLKYLNKLNIKFFSFYIAFLIGCIFIIILVIVLGENIMKILLKRKSPKKYDNIPYKKILIFIKLPNINDALKMEINENKKAFFKKYLELLSKEQITSLYNLNQNYYNRINKKIENKSNINNWVTFITLAISLVLTSLVNLFDWETVINESGWQIYFTFFIMIIILAYFVYKILIFAFNQIENTLVLDTLKKIY